MELRHLRYFVAVAEEGQVTRAAHRLRMQQPPLSQQLHALQREIGVQLFERQPRGVELTDAGLAFLAEVRIVLHSVDRAVEVAQQAARGKRGRLALGFTSSASFHPFVPRVFRSFRDTFPEVTLTLEESSTGDLVRGLREGRLHAAFTRTPIGGMQTLEVTHLLDEKMLIALPEHHRLSPVCSGSDEPLPLRALAPETFILYRRPGGSGLYDAVISACGRAGFSPNIGQEVPATVHALNLVTAGLGVSIIPASLAGHSVEGVGYRRIRDHPKLVAPLNLAYLRATESVVAREFIDLVLRLRHEGADSS